METWHHRFLVVPTLVIRGTQIASLALLASTFCAACGGDDDTVLTDAGGNGDAGGNSDAGDPFDAGAEDGGATLTDAAVDATTPLTDATAADGGVWPTCDAQPPGSDTKTIPQIWIDDPTFPTPVWVPNVYVSAISRGGCSASQSCQFFVQQETSYASLTEATHQSLRVGVSAATAYRFDDLAVGDRIDLYASAFRDTSDGRNELIFLVTDSLPGCAAVVGSGALQPVTVLLDDLSVTAYEDTIGPVLARIEVVSGRPQGASETFALWNTGTIAGGDITTVTSLSPFFLPGAAFTGLTSGAITDFSHVVGVFGLFVPPPASAGDPLVKYEMLYARSEADYPLAP